MISILLVAGAILFLLYGAVILYYAYAWISIPEFTIKTSYIPATKISVLIPARNEEGSIAACINSILLQDYPAELLEIIIIDDHSTDNTAGIVKSFRDKRISLISLQDIPGLNNINSYKKKAIETGIAASTGQLIVTTDADCYAKPNWLTVLASFYGKQNSVFLAAPVAITKLKSFIGIFQALDFMTLQGITGGAVHSRLHVMCNGANLAYTKSAFYAVNGFQGIDKLASGDDLLLMQKIAKVYPQKVHFIKSSAAIVNTQAVETIADFFNQRIRWASKSSAYDNKALTLILIIVYFFNVMMFVIPIVALFNNAQTGLSQQSLSISQLWIGLLVLKILIELTLLVPVAHFYKRLSLLFWFPVMQPAHIIYIVVAGFFGRFGSYSWKGRRVK